MSYQQTPDYQLSSPLQPESNNKETIIIGGVAAIVIILILVFVYTNYMNVTPNGPSGIWAVSPSSTLPFANCKGVWGACSKSCGEGTHTYKITSPAKGEGKACPEVDGASKTCKDKDCADDCVGEWLPCSASCGAGSGEGTQTYKVSQQKKGDGKSCSHGDGASRTCTAGNYILNCEQNHSNFKKFFESQYGNLFDMIPIKSKKTHSTQCELEYSLKFQGFPTLATDKRIFSLQKNDTNCTWDVIHMGESLLPRKKEEEIIQSGPCKDTDYTYTGGCGTLIAKCWDGGQGCRGDCYRWCDGKIQ